MRLLLYATLLIGGCQNAMRTQARLGVVNPDLPSAARSAVQATGGRDVFNVSPNLAVSGGGGVVFLIACALAINWTRTRRTLGAVVSAVEGLDATRAKGVKRRIARAALTAGVADYLHGMVRQKLSRRATRKHK